GLPRRIRHPELVSGSISPPAQAVQVEEWMLKQVQHDDDEAFFVAAEVAPGITATAEDCAPGRPHLQQARPPSRRLTHLTLSWGKTPARPFRGRWHPSPRRNRQSRRYPRTTRPSAPAP